MTSLYCTACGRPEAEYRECGRGVLPCPDLVPADPLTTVTLYCSTHDVTRTAKAVDLMRGARDLSHLCSEHCTVTLIPEEGGTPFSDAVSLDQAIPQAIAPTPAPKKGTKKAAEAEVDADLAKLQEDVGKAAKADPDQ